MRGKAIIIVSIWTITLHADPVAVNFKDYVMQSSTAAGTWTDPVAGKKYHSFGSVTYKFKNTNYYPLWFDGKPPGMKVGCGGISFDGGFLALLDVEKMGKQLSDASGKAAYGVMLSLLSSTPILGKVYENIKKWARTIQKIAQNACQIGKNWGKQNIDTDLTKEITDFVSDSDVGGYYNTVMEGSEEYQESVDDFVDDLASGDKNINSMVLKLFGASKPTNKDGGPKVASLSGISQGANIITKHITSDEATNKVVVNSMSSFFDGGVKTKSGDDVIAVDKSEANNQLDQLLFLMGLRYFGTTALNTENIKKVVGAISDDGSLSEAGLKDIMKRSKEGEVMVTGSIINIAPQVSDSTTLVDDLINGFSTEVLVPDYLFVDVEEAETAPCPAGSTDCGTPDDEKRKFRMVFLVSPTAENKMALSYPGSRAEMRKAVYTFMRRAGGSSKNANGDDLGVTTDATGAATETINTNLAPMCFSGLGRYAKTISRLELKGGGPSTATDGLKERIIEVGTLIVAENLIRGLAGGVLDQLTTSATEVGADAKAMAEFRKVVIERRDSALKVIRERYDSTMMENDLRLQFKTIEDDLNEQRAKTYR